MIVTIDGPAGAGKSSAARALARRLDFSFLDTGAMYRAVALAAIRRGLDWSDSTALPELARSLQIHWTGERVLLDGEDVTHAIRSSEVTTVTHYAANHPEVRAHLVELQRAVARDGNWVTEGRDQGTVVFPQAECKFFLTASPLERARRRWNDLQAHGERLTLDDVLATQAQRDQSDELRSVGPLRRADDAIEINTDDQDPEQVVSRMEKIVRTVMGTG
jgi:cytidylate kinase